MGANPDLRWWDIPTWVPYQIRQAMAGLATCGLACGLLGRLNVGLKGFLVGLACGLVVGLVLGHISDPLAIDLNDEPRMLLVRKPNRRELHFLFAVGLFGLVAAPLGLLVWLGMLMLYGLVRDGPSLLGVLRVGPGLICVLVGGLGATLLPEIERLWNVPLPTARAVSPIEIYRADRRQTLVGVLVGGLTGGLITGLLLGHMHGFITGLVLGHVYWLMGGLFLVLMPRLDVGPGPALQLIVLEASWGLRGQRVRFLPLLQTALERKVLRQVGGVFQFRHAALQDLLAGSYVRRRRR